VAAFCACCGAEITLKTEACPACGAPQHGMSQQPDLLRALHVETDYRETSEEVEAATYEGTRYTSARQRTK